MTKTVTPTVMDHSAKVKHDGVIHELHLPGIEVPRCQTCGEIYPTAAVDDQVSDALRKRLGILMPNDIRNKIKQLGLKQQQVAEQLGVAPETISRWVNGALIQSRAMDNLLRVFFAFPEVRDALRGADNGPAIGTMPDNSTGVEENFANSGAAADATGQEPEPLVSKAMVQQIIDEQIRPLRDQVRRLEDQVHGSLAGRAS